MLDIPQYEKWLTIRLNELVAEVKRAEKRMIRRRKIVASLAFPFNNPRPSQKELIATIEENMGKNKAVLIQAPTGLGKTMAVLYPVLSNALARGQKVIYLTPKNSQHDVALDASSILQKNGAKIKPLILTAKKKLCLKAEPICNAAYCEFAENHYTKLTENNVQAKLAKQKKLVARTFKKIAALYQVCPYELQMEMIADADVVICDYNYVFSPQASPSRAAKIGIGEREKPNLIIDEVHNLPNRAMDYYSPSLSAKFIADILPLANSLPPLQSAEFKNILVNCIAIIENCNTSQKRIPHLIDPPVQQFTDQERILADFLADYLMSDAVINNNDIVLTVFNYWTAFTAALEWITAGKKEFFTSYLPRNSEVKITCCDANEMIKTNYNEFAQVVGFSATLKPFAYYSQLSGLAHKKLHAKEFMSPFPKARRKIIIIPQISSRFSERNRNYSRVAQVITRITALKQGNYFAFFPSFDFMENVLRVFTPPTGFKILTQTRKMSHEQIKQLLAMLQIPNESHITFAVQGGMFSEGLDYPGNLAIGAFIVGTPLPNFDWEREKKKEYYEKYYAAGMDYAYIYPAMAKAVQAAGRVIRSETDKGIIILMDNRFLEASFAKCMPQDWFDTSPEELISNSILNDVEQFWLSVE